MLAAARVGRHSKTFPVELGEPAEINPLHAHIHVTRYDGESRSGHGAGDDEHGINHINDINAFSSGCQMRRRVLISSGARAPSIGLLRSGSSWRWMSRRQGTPCRPIAQEGPSVYTYMHASYHVCTEYLDFCRLKTLYTFAKSWCGVFSLSATVVLAVGYFTATSHVSFEPCP